MSSRAFVSAFLFLSASAFGQLPSFPGAEGFGAHAAGGRGGDVYIVTNLNASGAGSFADAVNTAPVAGRTIVFAVSGHIRLPSGSGGGLSISKSKITVAGQTAPGDGICFWNNTMNLTGDDLVLRHVRWRYGKQSAGGDAVDISGSQRIILDHCEVMFSTDENLSSFGTPPEFFTFQWSVNAWGLSGHSAGGLWDIDHATAHHTLWAFNHTRNPKCIAPSVFDWANNVVFGWDIGFNMAASGDSINRVNIRGSTFSHGGRTDNVIYGGGNNPDGSRIFKLHVADSALDGNNNGVLDVSKSNYAMVSAGTTYDAVPTEWPQTLDGVSGGAVVGVPVTVVPRLTAYKKVLSQAGALRMEYDAARPLHDEISALCIARTAAMQRGIIADPLSLGLSTGTALAALNSTAAPRDTDKDGMPDIWENALGMNPGVQNHNTVFPGSGGVISGSTFFPANSPVGYTHLEEYLHFKAQPHALVPRNTASSPSFIDVDLRRYTGGFTSSPVFTINNANGGATTQSGTGGAVVRFTPTQDTSGRAWFDFTVTDSAGSSWTQRFCVLVSATAIPRDLVWVGNGTTNPWDPTSNVWSRSGAATAFNDGDFVRLDDSGSAAPAIALSGTRQPAEVLVDASAKAYTFTGPGIIGGTGTLTKRGEGTLTLRSNNTYTGGTIIEDGALVLGLVGTATNSSGNVGSGPLTLLGDSTVTNAWVGTQLPLAAPIVVPADAEPTIYTGRNIRLSGALTGAGTLNLVNQTVTGNTFELAGPWAAFAGTLRISNAVANGGIRTIFNGGGFTGFTAATLELGAGNSINPVTNSGGNTFNIGALISTASDSILNGGTAGAPVYVIGALNTSTTFAGKLQGNARLTKTGTGTLTLTGASTHTGTTAVNEGSLIVNGSFGTSEVSVASGATLGGGGALAGNVIVSSGGTLDPQGTLATGGLTLASPTLRFDLSGTPGGANDRIQAASLSLSGTHTFEFALKDRTLGAGTYTLLNTTGTLTASSPTLLHNLVNTPRQTFALGRNASGSSPGSVWLTVTGSPVTLSWSGAQTTWDLATTSSWLNGAAADVFHDGDAVSFSDAATNGSVTISTALAPRSVLVNNATRAFTFGGAGIGGDCNLQKSGTGTLTLNAANTFSGGTLLDAGTIQLGNSAANAGALGSGAVTMNGGVLKMFSAGTGTHAGTLPNSLHVAGSARLEVAPRCGFSGDVTGAGTLDYRTNYVRADITGDWSGFTGQLQITTAGSGDFRIASSYAWPGLPQAVVNLASGTYFYMSGIVNNGAGTTIEIGALSGAGGSHLRGGITGYRTLTYRVGGRNVDANFSGNIGEQGTTTITALTKTGTAAWTLTGTCSHRGATIVESGTLRLTATGSFTQTSDFSVHNGATLDLLGGNIVAGGITFSEGSVLNYSGGTLTGETTLAGGLNVNLSGISGGQTLTLIQNPGLDPVAGMFVGKPEGVLLPSNGRTFRLSYAGGDGNDVTLTALSTLESWRFTHFGVTADSGSAAALFDANSDGEVNLIEFATAQNPHSATRITASLIRNGAVLEYTYTRSSAALADGVTFGVRWNDTLSPASWSDAGVTEQIVSDTGTMQTVRATVPAGSGQRFVHLRITAP